MSGHTLYCYEHGKSFPTMLVLWLGREFYIGKCGMTRSSQDCTSDLGEEMWDLKNAGIFSIPLLVPRSGFVQMIACDVTACLGDYKRTVLGSQNNSVC
ncbi:hypothetical protein AVEN_147328-1 [Araneus ventricosus]|uniref:Uncharacterized protein n=1 Tax=Araneus ventricosus TaxID=182803 RepID=A0A4Y2NWJ1_ARAVE|nr:hypothetical protein AVEN_147328-1 [Araneus ventricosus]